MSSTDATSALLAQDIEAPVQESMPHQFETGPFYSAEDEERLYSGQWSDELFHCCSDVSSCVLCTFTCFWPVLIWNVLNRLPSGSRLLPLGLSSRVRVMIVYSIACVVYLVSEMHGILAIFALLLMAVISMQIFGMVASVYKLRSPTENEAWVQAICCHPCFVARMVRHVGRARGFIAPAFTPVGVIQVQPSPTVVV